MLRQIPSTTTTLLLRRTTTFLPLRTFSTAHPTPLLKEIASKDEGGGSQNATPGWGGRPGSDHALHRDGNDAQSAPSQQARQDKKDGKEGSGAVSEKDERNANQRAKDDHPESPMVIGMNDERGGKH